MLQLVSGWQIIMKCTPFIARRRRELSHYLMGEHFILGANVGYDHVIPVQHRMESMKNVVG